jgi:DNA-binding CsgD family transcriptional regulator
MLQSWTLTHPAPSRQLDLGTVAALLDAARPAAPALALLAVLQRTAGADYLSLMQYDRGDDGAPTLVDSLSRSPEAAHVTVDCFALYRRHFYGLDAMTPLAGRLRSETRPDAPLIALRQGIQDVPNAAWRESIYDRAQLCDRLTLLYAPAPRTAFAINLYRSSASGGYGPEELDRVLDVAPLVRSVHRNALGAAAQTVGTPARVAQAEQTLAARAPRLSLRERQVCARIAVGLTADGIGADLGVAPSTVVTLRKRAYAKLGVHNRLALARLVC